jgi:hypothetical protein
MVNLVLFCLDDLSIVSDITVRRPSCLSIKPALFNRSSAGEEVMVGAFALTGARRAATKVRSCGYVSPAIEELVRR